MGCTEDSEWKDEVREKLVEILGEDDPESLCRVLFYLDEQDKNGMDPAWRTLKATLKSAKAFEGYAKRLADDTKTAEKDPNFLAVMNRVYASFMMPSDHVIEEGDSQGFEIVRNEDAEVTAMSGFMGLAKAWQLIPASSQTMILAMLPKVISNKAALSAVDEIASLVVKTNGTFVMVGLAAVALAWDVVRNMVRWWRGEISGKRCLKNCLDSTLTIGAGMGGGVGGAAIGTFVGPIGTVVGGVVGGIVSAQAARILSDRLTQFLFGLPKDEALESAYNFFGVSMTASADEINKAFHRLCLKHHPDKGGKVEDFILVQMNMGTIKIARGELL